MPLEGYQFMILAINVVRFSTYDDVVAFYLNVIAIASANKRIGHMTMAAITAKATNSDK
jgi:uncharacterized membrane protein